MFSSSNSVNPNFLLSSFHHSPSFDCHDTDDIFLHHHHDLLVGHLSPATAPVTDHTVIDTVVSNNATMTTKQDIDRPNGDCYCPSNFVPCKTAVKKDRHSKICTAQGLRDRRVRLSIEIARKFFDLQDMLGFDKASKTLEWLLTKSTTAIMDLALAKSLSSTSECEVFSGINSKRKSVIGLSKKKKMKVSNLTASHLLAKEVRAKARARARERTREKMCNRLNQLRLNQLRSSTQFEEPSSHSLAIQEEKKEFIEESIMIKRKLKPSSNFGYQQNLAISKDVSSNNNYLPNLPQNWGISSAVTRASFCAMTNMNLSTELQIYGKPWELHNN